MNINQEQLNIFKTVIESGSFSAAARKLGKVPSAVSMSIANLEIDLNLSLFERTGREPIPTAHALTLYEKTQLLLIEMNQWKQHAMTMGEGLEPSLDIVVVSELSHTNWTDYVSLLGKRFPDLQINIFTAPQEDAVPLLMQNAAQLALMFEREQLAYSEQFIEVKREALIAVAAHDFPLAQLDQVSFKQLQASRQIVVASRDPSIHPELLYSKKHWRTDNHYSASSMIVQGLGWGILPLEMFNDHPHLSLQLKQLNFSDFTPKFEYFVDLVWRRESPLGAAANYLIEHIRQQRQQALQ